MLYAFFFDQQKTSRDCRHTRYIWNNEYRIRRAPDNVLYAKRFLDLYEKIKAPVNGYFSAQGIPYHSVETMICEAPDYGHETTSEAISYWFWLEGMFGFMTNQWTDVATVC